MSNRSCRPGGRPFVTPPDRERARREGDAIARLLERKREAEARAEARAAAIAAIGAGGEGK